MCAPAAAVAPDLLTGTPPDAGAAEAPAPLPTFAILDTFVKDLALKIDEGERARINASIVDVLRAIRHEEADQAYTKTAMKERLAGLDLRKNKLIEALDKGVETRPIDVQRVALYDEGLIIERRADTHEELFRRGMTADERQLPLSEDVARAAASALVEHSQSAESEREGTDTNLKGGEHMAEVGDEIVVGDEKHRVTAVDADGNVTQSEKIETEQQAP